MSGTIVDMPKVCQMLDAGWSVRIEKNPLGSYGVWAHHNNERKMVQVREALEKDMRDNCKDFLRETGISSQDAVEERDFDDGELFTDDFTPEQALTRMAYKTFGEILHSEERA